MFQSLCVTLCYKLIGVVAVAMARSTVDWEKVAGQLPDQAQVRDGELILPRVRVSDEGTYRCTATDAAGARTSRRVDVIVQGLRLGIISIFFQYRIVKLDFNFYLVVGFFSVILYFTGLTANCFTAFIYSLFRRSLK